MRCVCLLFVAAACLAQGKRESEHASPAVYILLLGEARKIDAEALTKQASKAIGIPFVNASSDPVKKRKAAAVVREIRPGRVFWIETRTMLFVVELDLAPLWVDRISAAREHPHAAEAVLVHQATLTIQAKHALRAKTAGERRGVYRDLGKVTLGLLGDDVAGIWFRGGIVGLPDPDLARTLLAKDPRAELRKRQRTGRISVPPDHRDVAAAIAQARATFDRFERAFEARRGERFAVKIKLGNEHDQEFVWATVKTIRMGVIEGTLQQRSSTRKKNAGQTLWVTQETVVDWFYVKEGRMVGGYTVKAVQELARRGP